MLPENYNEQIHVLLLGSELQLRSRGQYYHFRRCTRFLRPAQSKGRYYQKNITNLLKNLVQTAGEGDVNAAAAKAQKDMTIKMAWSTLATLLLVVVPLQVDLINGATAVRAVHISVYKQSQLSKLRPLFRSVITS